MNATFRGKSALVTGASAGLGQALAQQLAAAGARGALVARRAPPLAEVVAHIKAAGGQAHAIVADVADKDAAHRIAGQAAALAGPVDLLINNAGSLGPTPLQLLIDTDCEDLERALAVNLVGAFRLTKIVAGSMLLRGGGTIVNVSTDAAVDAYPRWGAYGAAKAALDHTTRTWTAELSGTGVRVLRFDPGEMRTQMHADAVPDADPATLGDPAEAARRLLTAVGGAT